MWVTTMTEHDGYEAETVADGGAGGDGDFGDDCCCCQRMHLNC